MSRYQKGRTNLDFTEARDSEWQWHQLGHVQVCTSLQTDNHAITPPLEFFTGRMPFLPPNQQRQSTEGKIHHDTDGTYITAYRNNDDYSKGSGTFFVCIPRAEGCGLPGGANVDLFCRWLSLH